MNILIVIIFISILEIKHTSFLSLTNFVISYSILYPACKSCENNISIFFSVNISLVVWSIKALTQLESTKDAINYFKDNFKDVEQLICTLGAKGSIVISEGRELMYNAVDASVVDKTGAGDFFAAGYLYGMQKKLSINDAAEIANKSAAHVISEIGVRPKKEFS